MTQPPFPGNDFFDQIDSVARNLTGNAFRLKRDDPDAPQKFTEFVAQSEQEFSAIQPTPQVAQPTQTFRDFEQGGFQQPALAAPSIAPTLAPPSAMPPLTAARTLPQTNPQDLAVALAQLQERGQIDAKVLADIQTREGYEQTQPTAFRDEFDAADRKSVV